MNKISVIIPMYNGEQTIKRCLDSILNQTEEVYEVIIVNDGSIDNSEEIIKKYQKKYQNIKYYYKDNSGVAETRNYGISKAEGNYILFVDCDDYIQLNLVKTIKKYIDNNVDIIKFKLKMEDLKGNEIEKIDGPVFDVITGEEAFNILYYQDILIDSPCVYVIKKDLFIDNNFKFKGTYHEDFGLIPLVLASAKSVVSLPNYFYTYVQGENSITRNEDYNKTIIKMKDVLFHYDNMVKSVEKLKLQPDTIDNIKIYYTNAIILKLKEIKKEDRKKFIEEIKKRKMYQNIKPKNLKQIIKRMVLKININLYLKIK